VAYGSENNDGQEAVRRVLKGAPSGRIALLLFACGFLALGIYGGSMVLTVASAVAVLWAAWSVVQAAWRRHALSRVGRRDPTGPAGR